MKRFCILLLLITVILTSCTVPTPFKTDDQIVDDIFNPLISAINARDKDAIKNLFSYKAVLDDATFDDDLQGLLDYCQGQLAVYSSSSLGSSEQKNGDYKRKTIQKNYEIESDNAKFRVYVYVVATDTSKPEEVGLWSFYIIKVDESMNLDYSYTGDSKNTPGINIGIENARDDAKLADVILHPLINAIDARDKEAIKNLFSDKAISADETFDEDLTALFDYCQGSLDCSDTLYSDIDILRQTDGNRVKKTICLSRLIYAENAMYQIRICVIIPDISKPNEAELWSLYILQVYDDMDYDYSYKGDGKNTPGINVGVETPSEHEDM